MRSAPVTARGMRTAAKTLIALIVAPSLICACVSDPEARLRFEDPSVRGSLMDFDRPIVPKSFRGLWANTVAACRDPGEGVWLYVHERAMGRMAFTREGVWLYAPEQDRMAVTRQGVWLYMHEQVASAMAVTRVAGYSDDATAIRVDLTLPDSDESHDFYFELALDRRHMRVTGRGELTPTLYYKCR